MFVNRTQNAFSQLIISGTSNDTWGHIKALGGDNIELKTTKLQIVWCLQQSKPI